MELLGYSPAAVVGLACLGFAVGTFGTLIGAGGGFLLAPALLLLYPNERPETITAISLAVVFFNAASGSLAYARLKRIDYRSGLLFALAALPGAYAGATSTNFLSRKLFNLIFGVLLVLLGVFVFFTAGTSRTAPSAEENQRGKGNLLRQLTDRDGTHYSWSYSLPTGLAISTGVGYLSSLLGIGGGIIHVPALARMLRFPVPIATATSHFILALVALAGTITHVVLGAFAHGIRRALFLSVGVVLGAQLGALLSHHARGVGILRALAVALSLVGLRLLLMR